MCAHKSPSGTLVGVAARILSGFVVVVLLLAPLFADPPINAIAVVPDGKTVLAGGQAGLVRLSGPGDRPASVDSVSVETVHAIRFSADGSFLAVAGGSPGEYGLLQVFSWPDMRLHPVEISHDDVIFDVAWSGDGTRLAAASLDGTITVVHRVSSTPPVHRDAHPRGVTGVVYLSNRTGTGELTVSLVSCGRDQAVRVWTGDSELRLARTLNNHTASVSGIVARPVQSPGPPVVASAGDDRTVRFWQPTTGRMMRFVRLDSVPVSLAWLPDGSRLLAGCQDGSVREINPDDASVTATRTVSSEWLSALAVFPDGRRVVAGTRTGIVWIDR